MSVGAGGATARREYVPHEGGASMVQIRHPLLSLRTPKRQVPGSE
jgi:hypothetical protein